MSTIRESADAVIHHECGFGKYVYGRTSDGSKAGSRFLRAFSKIGRLPFDKAVKDQKRAEVQREIGLIGAVRRYNRYRKKEHIMTHELFNLEGKHAFVTGSGSGIGLGMAEGLLEAGCTVVLHSRGESAVAQAQRLSGMGYAAKVVTGDLTEESWVKQIFTQALEKLDGRIDILVNCAGAQYRAPAMDFPLEKFDEVMNVNNRSVFILSKLLAEN